MPFEQQLLGVTPLLPFFATEYWPAQDSSIHPQTTAINSGSRSVSRFLRFPRYAPRRPFARSHLDFKENRIYRFDPGKYSGLPPPALVRPFRLPLSPLVAPPT